MITMATDRAVKCVVGGNSSCRALLNRPQPPGSLWVFRTGFGLLAAFSAVRFMALGWVDSLLMGPDFHFSWFSWLPMPNRAQLYSLMGVQVLGGFGIAAGWRTRTHLILWLVSFTYVELLEKSLYLNHYVLFSLLGLWLLVLPASTLRRRDPEPVPTWGLWLLRAQLASVYVWAGLAKLNSDWLLRGEPLKTWLQAHADLPWVGPWLANDVMAIGMSWGGALYDLAIPWFLLCPRTRGVALVLVVGFHAAVGLLFPIGIFPALMILGATLFLSPRWPQAWLRWPDTPGRPSVTLGRGPALSFVVTLALIFLLPGRFILWGTDVNWSERGYRFAWRVMLNEKTGFVEYRVFEPSSGRRWIVQPGNQLTALQHQSMRTQPDMIRDYALFLARQHREQGRLVEVFAEAWVSLNGRPAQRLLRPDVDLTRGEAELDAQGWIVPLAEPGPSSG